MPRSLAIVALFGLALAAGCRAPEKPSRAPRPQPEGREPPAVEPRAPKQSAQIALLEEARSIKAFPKELAAEAVVAALLDDPTWPAETTKNASTQMQQGTLVVRIPLSPVSPTGAADIVGWVGERHAFRVDRVELTRRGDLWEGAIFAAPIRYDASLTGPEAQAALDALRAYREMRGEARKAIGNALLAHPLARRIAIDWDASDGEYELEVTNQAAAPAPGAAPGRAAVEPRPRLRRAEEVLRDKAGDYFATAELGTDALRGRMQAAVTQAAGEAHLEVATVADAREILSLGPVPLAAERFSLSVRGPREGLDAFFRRLLDERRLAVSEIRLRAVEGGFLADARLLALALDLDAARGAEAQGALDELSRYDGERGSVAKVALAASGLAPQGVRVGGLEADRRAVVARLDGASKEQAEAYAAALLREIATVWPERFAEEIQPAEAGAGMTVAVAAPPPSTPSELARRAPAAAAAEPQPAAAPAPAPAAGPPDAAQAADRIRALAPHYFQAADFGDEATLAGARAFVGQAAGEAAVTMIGEVEPAGAGGAPAAWGGVGAPLVARRFAFTATGDPTSLGRLLERLERQHRFAIAAFAGERPARGGPVTAKIELVALALTAPPEGPRAAEALAALERSESSRPRTAPVFIAAFGAESAEARVDGIWIGPAGARIRIADATADAARVYAAAVSHVEGFAPAAVEVDPLPAADGRPRFDVTLNRA
jgi:hypothetical protein